MSNSYQHDVPSARVNISLDVETGLAQKSKELPMKLLVMDDFSHGRSNGSLAERERVTINKHNFNHVLSAVSPKLSFSVPNRLDESQEDLHVVLEPKTLEDFHPEKLINHVPELKKLMAMRHLLKDLKSSVIDHQGFRKALEQIMHDKKALSAIKQELASQSTFNG